MAIDTPLGFPDKIVRLITRQGHADPDAISGLNHYLFRDTERHLFKRGLKPLSAIKDMLGSQSTKGMHTLAKFAPHVESCGVWTDGRSFNAIEAYPSACRNTSVVKNLRKNHGALNYKDEEDAFICALVAHLFVVNREALEPPSEEVPVGEGWIWTTKEMHQAWAMNPKHEYAAMDAELGVLEQRREKTCALKQAMMQEFLTGRTRLV